MHNTVRFYALHNTVLRLGFMHCIMRLGCMHRIIRSGFMHRIMPLGFMYRITVRFYVSIPIHFSSPQSYPTLSARKMIYAMKDGVLLYIVVRSFKSVDEDGYYRSQSSVISYLC